MPWVTPTLAELRALNRDNVQSQLRSGPMVPNSVLRVMSDSNAALAYLTLLYINWLTLQLMPDTAEQEFLDRHANIWLSQPRKTATFAQITLAATGIAGIVIPSGSILQGNIGSGAAILFQSIAPVTMGASGSAVVAVAQTAGATGLLIGSQLGFTVGISGIDGATTISSIVDGVDEENDDDLRVRVLFRIQEPPMGGDSNDYVAWALEVPGVTRAWAATDMGIGTIMVRVMMDHVRATTDPLTNGFPNSTDIAIVQAHIDGKRPVAIKDMFVQSPIPEPIYFTVSHLVPDTPATRAAIVVSVTEMLASKARPSWTLNGVHQLAQDIFNVWVAEAVLAAPGVDHFDLVMVDHIMPSNSAMAVMGTVTFI